MDGDRSIAKPPSVAGPFVPEMHGLRAWAIFAVVVFHLFVATGYAPQHELPHAFVRAGFLSLDALFFTTGFVLFLPVTRSGFGDVRAFAIRRLARMAPPYYVCLLVILLAWPLLTTAASASLAHHGVLDYLAHVGFVQREVLTNKAGLGVDGPLWAISMDFAFYLVLPLVATAYLRRPLAGLAIGLGISLAWRLAIDEQASGTGLLVQAPLFAVDFAAGMTAAWAYTEIRKARLQVSTRLAGTVAVAAFAALAVTAYAAGHATPKIGALWVRSDWSNLAFPLVLGVGIVAVTAASRDIQWPFTNRPVQWFSEISYSVFLYHVLFVSFAYATLGVALDRTMGSFVTLAAVIVPLTLAVSYLSYRYVELPSRRYGRRLARRVAGDDSAELGTQTARAAALGAAQERA